MNYAPIWSHANDETMIPYHYLGCGLDDVYLANGYEIHNTDYGKGVRIKNLDELHDAISRYLVQFKKNLKGNEIRFLRHQMDVTQTELAQLMGCSSQTIARYEKEQSKFCGPADRMLRVLVEDHLQHNGSARDLLDLFDSMDDQGNVELLFEDKNGHWECSVNAA